MKHDIYAIVFDAYGTLFNVNSIDILLKKYFGDKSDNISSVWRQKQLEYTWLRCLMGQYKNFSAVTLEAFHFACEYCSVQPEIEHTHEIMQEYHTLKTYADVNQNLGQLSEKYKLGILSNANQELLEDGTKHNQIDSYFDHILSADAIEEYKPKPAVYELAANAFNTNLHHILFISSNTWDISGATAYGFRTCWVNRFNKTYDKMGYDPEFLINSIDELDSLIENS